MSTSSMLRTIETVTGDLLDQDVDVIVIAWNRNMKLHRRGAEAQDSRYDAFLDDPSR